MKIPQRISKRKEYCMMNKKVLIISSSPRKNGNSETLAASFAKGAQEAGHQVETVFLREKQIGFCKGCLACLKLGHCVIQDDAVEIAAKMHDAASAVSSRLCWTVPIHCSERIMPLRKPTCWRQRQRMSRKRWKVQSRQYRAGWTALADASLQLPFSLAV